MEIKKGFDMMLLFAMDMQLLKVKVKKGNISTLNIAIKRLIQNNFKMCELDKFNTSKLHYIIEVHCDENAVNNKFSHKICNISIYIYIFF